MKLRKPLAHRTAFTKKVHNQIYLLSELIIQKWTDSKQQYISSKPRKGGGWALGNCELFKRITATPTPLPPPLKNHWPPRVTRPLPLVHPIHPLPRHSKSFLQIQGPARRRHPLSSFAKKGSTKHLRPNEDMVKQVFWIRDFLEQAEICSMKSVEITQKLRGQLMQRKVS